MEAECLRKYFDELTHGISSHEVSSLVVTQLYCKGVFTSHTKDELLSIMDKSDPLPHKTAASVVTEIQACVSSDPSRLSRVIEVLRGHELCRGVAEKISCMVTNGGKAKPLNAHNALRLLQDSYFNVTKHWHQMGGDLGVSLDNRRRLQELAIRTQNYDGALEECLDWWISNTPDASWEILVETVERHEVSTSDRMRDLLGLPKIQRTNRSGRLPRQGSSLEGVTDHVDPEAPHTSIPIRQTPSPSTTGSATNESTQQLNHTTQLLNQATINTSSSTTNGLSSSVIKHESTATPNGNTPHDTKSGASVSSSTVSPPNPGPSFHMECQLLNGSTNQVIKSSQTTLADIRTPVYRDIRIKKVSRYTSVPPLTPLVVTVTVNTTCYLYIINIGSTGNITTLIPNALDDDNKADPAGDKPLHSLQFPPPDADYEFELDSNSGTETVVVLAYNEQVSVDQAKDDYKKMKENKVVVERDITIKRKTKVTVPAPAPVVIPLGTVEMQFSVKSS